MLTASRTVNEVRFILGDAPFSLFDRDSKSDSELI
jgi:hypothetical protein